MSIVQNLEQSLKLRVRGIVELDPSTQSDVPYVGYAEMFASETMDGTYVMSETGELDVAVAIPPSLNLNADVSSYFLFTARDVDSGASVQVEASDVEVMHGADANELFASLRFVQRDYKLMSKVADEVHQSIRRAFLRNELGRHIIGGYRDEVAVADLLVDQLGPSQKGTFEVTATYQLNQGKVQSNAIRVLVHESKLRLTLPRKPMVLTLPGIAIGSALVPPLAALLMWRKQLFSTKWRIALSFLQLTMTIVILYLLYLLYISLR